MAEILGIALAAYYGLASTILISAARGAVAGPTGALIGAGVGLITYGFLRLVVDWWV